MKKLGFSAESIEQGVWKSDQHWVSHFNFPDNATNGFSLPDQVIVHDSTLRDGEQAPGVSFSTDQKIELAQLLDAAGVQYIEAGFPAVSRADAESVEKIATMGLGARVTCLARAMEKDIDLAADCGVWGAILEVPIGYPRLKYQFEWDEDEVLKRTLHALDHAESRGLNIILFLIDTARVSGPFLQRFILEAGQSSTVKRIAVVDTLGAATPHAMTTIVSAVKTWTETPLEVHCHNDFGLGTINTISGITAGADVFSGTVNGLGQRAGNAAIEEVIMALHLLYGVPVDSLDLTLLRELSRKVQEYSGITMPQYKSVVGEKLFQWESGIPTAALRKLPTTVEPYIPDLVGAEHSIILGKKAGKANILFKIEEMGIQVTEEQINAIFVAVKERALETNGPVSDQEFSRIVSSISK